MESIRYLIHCFTPQFVYSILSTCFFSTFTFIFYTQDYSKSSRFLTLLFWATYWVWLFFSLFFALCQVPQNFAAIYSSVKGNWSFMTINYVKKSTKIFGSCVHNRNLSLDLVSLENSCSGVKRFPLSWTD